MHKRIHRKYGKASSYRCADCPNQAHDWSLEPGKQYSSNVEDYKPRCRACHLKIDMTAERRQNVSVGLKKAYAEGRR
jgi:DNA-directed RNA polymerase subunit RPC12/RpoP